MRVSDSRRVLFVHVPKTGGSTIDHLFDEEIDDARRVLVNGGGDLHAAQQTSLVDAQTLLSQAIAATDPAVRKARTESAITIVQNAKNAFGTNMNFQLGTGNLMF